MNRERIQDRLAPLFAEFTTAVEAATAALLEQVTDAVPELEREDLVNILSSLSAPSRDKPRKSTRSAAKVVRAPRSAKVAAEKKPRAKMKCRKCGALGFRSDGCGSTHNVTSPGPAAERAPQPPVRVERSSASAPATPSSPPPHLTKSDRFSRIEAAARARRDGAIG